MADSLIFRNYVGSDCDWNVGGLFAHDGFIFRLQDTCKKLNIKFPIEYVFGSIPCLFQGGRVSPQTADIGDAEDLLKEYGKRGIGCRLTFSNTRITDEDLSDEVSNRLLACVNAGENNGVIVSSNLLARYIRNRYPNLTVVSSLVKPSVEIGLGNDTAEYYNNLFDLYDVVVVNPSIHDNLELLSAIEHKDRVEFLVNHRCRRNCTMAKKHYELQLDLEQGSLRGEDVEKYGHALLELNEDCLGLRVANPLDTNILSVNDINRLRDMGFKHFKLEGRDYNGITFMRDIGHWIFNPDSIYLSLIHSIQNGPV